MALYVNGTKMLGALTSDPTSNNTEGDQYFNTVENAYKVYNGTEWVEIFTDYVPSGSTTLKGSVQVLNNDPLLDLKDANNSGVSTYNEIRGSNVNGAARWKIGQISTSNESLYIYNYATDSIRPVSYTHLRAHET